MKKILSVLLAAVLTVGTASWACADSGQSGIRLTVDGKEISLPQDCLVVNGQVYLPAEAFVGAIGGEYSYSAEDNRIVITFGTGGEEAFSPVGTWLLGDADGTYMVFEADGTGRAGAENERVLKLDMRWKLSGDVIVLSYELNGKPYEAEYNIVREGNETVIVYAANASRKFRRSGDTSSGGSDSGIVGTWSSAISDGSVQLIIHEDGSAILAVGDTGYECTWMLEGEALTLTQKNSPISGTYDGTSIVLQIGDKQLTFTR